MFPATRDRAATESPSLTIAGTLYEHLRNDILYAKLRPGQRLRSEALRRDYGGGVGTVREALNRLRAEGLVHQEDQRGFRVSPVSLVELQELTKTRCWVNAVAITASVADGDLAWEEGVLLAFHRLARNAPGEPNDPASRDLHRTFHAALYAACGSRWLIAFADSLFASAVRYQSLARAVETDERDFNAEHRAITEAALARNAPVTIALLDRHFSETADRVARLATLENVAS